MVNSPAFLNFSSGTRLPCSEKPYTLEMLFSFIILFIFLCCSFVIFLILINSKSNKSWMFDHAPSSLQRFLTFAFFICKKYFKIFSIMSNSLIPGYEIPLLFICLARYNDIFGLKDNEDISLSNTLLKYYLYSWCSTVVELSSLFISWFHVSCSCS